MKEGLCPRDSGVRVAPTYATRPENLYHYGSLLQGLRNRRRGTLIGSGPTATRFPPVGEGQPHVPRPPLQPKAALPPRKAETVGRRDVGDSRTNSSILNNGGALKATHFADLVSNPSPAGHANALSGSSGSEKGTRNDDGGTIGSQAAAGRVGNAEVPPVVVRRRDSRVGDIPLIRLNRERQADTLDAAREAPVSMKGVHGGRPAVVTVCTLGQDAAAPLTPGDAGRVPGVARPEARSPDHVARYGDALTAYEVREIVSYHEVFYVGEKHVKVQADPGIEANNFGYDDATGDYNIKRGDHLAYRYEIVGELGRGTFGIVVRCVDHKLKVHVAVKIIKNRPKFRKQGRIEVQLLRTLRCADPHGSSNIVRILDDFAFRSHQVIVVELLGENLYEMCRASRFKPVPLPRVAEYARQLLVALDLMKKYNIVHCDVKPENILLCGDGDAAKIKLIDFGSGCFTQEQIYVYIQSRFYRAPEVILGVRYSSAIDMWSVGCVLAELANGYPLFPGESEFEQLQCIMEYLGVPPRQMLDKCPRRDEFFNRRYVPHLTPNSYGRTHHPATKELHAFLRQPPSDDTGFCDFVRRCLEYVPDARWTPQQALKHRWLAGSPGAVGGSFLSTTDGQLPPVRR